MSSPPRYRYEGFERAALQLLMIIARRALKDQLQYSGRWEDDRTLEEIDKDLTTPLNTRL